MARFRAALLILIVSGLLFSACAASNNTTPSAEELFFADIKSIANDIRVMYEEVDGEYLHEPFLYIALADIDFDGIPEFFYGYQTITGSHNKIWYRAYSLSDRAMISSEHTDSCWSTYIQGDTRSAFFYWSRSFYRRILFKRKRPALLCDKIPCWPRSPSKNGPSFYRVHQF